MKYLFVVLFLFACKKETTQPAPTPQCWTCVTQIAYYWPGGGQVNDNLPVKVCDLDSKAKQEAIHQDTTWYKGENKYRTITTTTCN